eukprot:6610643-Prymnesium_polylepis.1
MPELRAQVLHELGALASRVLHDFVREVYEAQVPLCRRLAHLLRPDLRHLLARLAEEADVSGERLYRLRRLRHLIQLRTEVARLEGRHHGSERKQRRPG